MQFRIIIYASFIYCFFTHFFINSKFLSFSSRIPSVWLTWLRKKKKKKEKETAIKFQRKRWLEKKWKKKRFSLSEFLIPPNGTTRFLRVSLYFSETSNRQETFVSRAFRASSIVVRKWKSRFRGSFRESELGRRERIINRRSKQWHASARRRQVSLFKDEPGVSRLLAIVLLLSSGK